MPGGDRFSSSLAVSGDGLHFVCRGYPSKVWQLQNNQLVELFEAKTSDKVVFAPNNRHFFSSSYSTVEAWNVENQSRELLIEVQTGGEKVELSRDGNLLAVKSGSEAIKVLRLPRR